MNGHNAHPRTDFRAGRRPVCGATSSRAWSRSVCTRATSCARPGMPITWSGDVLRSGVHSRVQRYLGVSCRGSSSGWRRSRRAADAGARGGNAPSCAQPRPPTSRCSAGSSWPVRHRWRLRRPSAGTGSAAAVPAGGGAAGAAAAGRSVLAASSPRRAASDADADAGRRGNGDPQVMLRDPRLDQLLAAHQQAGRRLADAFRLPAQRHLRRAGALSAAADVRNGCTDAD